MATRCLVCGTALSGVAQFCDACEAKELVRTPAPEIRPIPRSASNQGTSSAYLINLSFLAVVGGLLLGVATWLLAFGGAESIGLRSDDPPQRAAIVPPMQSPTPPAELGFVPSDCKVEMPAGETP